MGSADPFHDETTSAPAGADSEFRALAEVLPHMVWLSRREGTLDYFNRRGTEYFGLSFGELADLFITAAAAHPDDRDHLLSAWRDALRAGEPLNLEARLLRHDGVYRWHLLRVQPLTDTQGNIVRWLGTAIDVHDVREANERNAFLLNLTRELAAITSPQELVCAAMARLRARLDASRVMLVEIDAQQREAVILRQSGASDSEVEVTSAALEPFEQFAEQARRGHPIVFEDTRTDPRSAHMFEKWYGPEGIGAMVCAPRMQGGVLVALLSVTQDRPRSWSESEVELVRRVADIVWPALEKARADRALAMSEERLRLVQAVAHMGTWEYVPERTLTFLSPEAFELFGLTPQDPQLFESWLARVDPRDIEAVRNAVNECLERGVTDIEYRYTHPERGTRWIYSKAGVVHGKGQQFLVGISLDVTERREAEEALKEINQRKDEFLAMLAHELRNPLAPIRNTAQILRVHAAGKPELEWARSVIERQTRHLARLVDDLLDVSRMVRGQIALQRSIIDLHEVIRHAIETARPLVRARRHRLEVKLPPEPVRLEGDLTRLAQVVSNLLNNAAKYTDEGGRIWLEARVEGPQVSIHVRDTGHGIAPALLPRVFDLFTQADRTLDRAQGGLGIGLTLVKRLVEMHGGTVEALSDGPGKGAEFIVRLPISTRPAVAPEPAAKPEPPRPESGGLRILIVDDNVDAADSIAMLLNMEGHQTATVNKASAALEAAETFRPDVVLLDIGLPEMDGYEVARRLRSNQRIEHMRLVAITGYGQPADRERAAAAGFDLHLVKPVEPAVLSEFLRTLRSHW